MEGWMDPFGRFTDMAAGTEGMRYPVRCRWCSGVYDLGTVTVTGRYTDCSMWKAPCCGVTADDRKPPWGVSHYTELPRQDAPPRCDRALDTASETCPTCFRQHTWLLED